MSGANTAAPPPWYLYLLNCADGTLYTGITTDPQRRLQEHLAGRGARYTGTHRPVGMLGLWQFPDQGSATRAERQFKHLARGRKLALCGRRAAFSGADFCSQMLSEVNGGQVQHFCPVCGGPLERQQGSGAPATCTLCGRPQYRNPKPCAGALVVREGRLLLVRRAAEPYRGQWDIPGGFMEEQETPQACVMREVREETGLEIKPLRVWGYYPNRCGDSAEGEGEWCLNIYFLAEVSGGVERAGDDALELGWFDAGELPEQIAFEHERQVLAEWARAQARRHTRAAERSVHEPA